MRGSLPTLIMGPVPKEPHQHDSLDGADPSCMTGGRKGHLCHEVSNVQGKAWLAGANMDPFSTIGVDDRFLEDPVRWCPLRVLPVGRSRRSLLRDIGRASRPRTSGAARRAVAARGIAGREDRRARSVALLHSLPRASDAV